MKQRKSVRRAVKVGCEAVAEDGFRLLGKRTLDLSSSGMLVESRGAFVRVGEDVVVSFQPPRSRLWLDAVAKVARIERGKRRGDRAHAIGLEFVEMSPSDRAILDAKLRGLPPPIPRRKPPVDYAGMVRTIAER
ncbi:MAG: PilZ domain-containing protein [Sandaracinaceae bacterium]|nr:PilZ domain-containing protein [Sandaracinaceae bacterium]